MPLKMSLETYQQGALFADLVTVKHTDRSKVFLQAILGTKDTECLGTYLHSTSYIWKYRKSFPPTDILENYT